MDNKLYDDYGKYRGRISESGKIYDDYEKYKGRISESGEIYDDYGKYKGKISESGKIYDDYGKCKGRISENGEIYDDYGKYKGRFSKKREKISNSRNDFSNKENVANGSLGCGVPFLLIIIGLLVIYLVFSAGPGIFNGMINSFMVLIFLAVAICGGIVGMFCQENQFSTMFVLDYIILMIFWFMILSQEDMGGGLEEIFASIMSVIIGFVLMGIIGIIVAGISYLVKTLLEYLFRWKTCKIVITILILAYASIIIWWFTTQDGFFQILDMIDEWNNQVFF